MTIPLASNDALPFDDLEDEPLPFLGERLQAMGAITRDQLHIALHEQRQTNQLLGAILVRLGFLDEATLAAVLADRAGLEPVDLKRAPLDPALLRRLPHAAAERCRAIPLRLEDDTLHLAMADPHDLMAMDEIRRHFPRPLILAPHVASKTDIENVLNRSYATGTPLDAILRELETGTTDTAAEHPTVRLVDTLLADAVRRGASDLHLEPEGSFVRIRVRIDGDLEEVRALHNDHWPALVHRLKIMADMNIADTRNIQDGRFQRQINGGPVDFRVATMPTVWGETLSVRVLDHRRALLPLPDLGFSPESVAILNRLMERPHGVTLVTGPTGGGKTTTLYAILRQLSAINVNIVTLEEPIEYKLNLIRQTAVREDQGLTFATGIRGALRMDPDILFVGEVRDSDTASMALRAAMTGHQVYSTLHCNDAFGAIPRLLDLGASPRALGDNLNGIVAQRLVRKLCPHCKGSRRATLEECALLRCDPQNPPTLAIPKGCEFCDDKGTRGRTVIAEILDITPELNDLLTAGAGRLALTRQARAEGFRTLRDDATARVLRGDIALDDVRRAVVMTQDD